MQVSEKGQEDASFWCILSKQYLHHHISPQSARRGVPETRGAGETSSRAGRTTETGATGEGGTGGGEGETGESPEGGPRQATAAGGGETGGQRGAPGGWGGVW